MNKLLIFIFSIFFIPLISLAQQADTGVSTQNLITISQTLKLDSGDTSWMLVSTALVMLMTPGLAFFYGGMARRKNVLGTMMHSFVALGIVTVVWILYGYSLAFGPDIHHFIGSLNWAFLRNVGLEPSKDYCSTVPHQVFMMFQMMFAIITPALISGAVAERIKFSTYLIFLILWITFVYAPLAHWTWAVGGWLKERGVLDFAGGVPVEIASGASSLAAALVVGKRKGYGMEPMPPHNMSLTLIGTGLLWFGWFGFNAGSAISSGSLAVSAFIATHIAGASAALSWMFLEWLKSGKPTALGTASGAVAGLVAITPSCGYVTPIGSFITGLIAGIVCYEAVSLKNKLGYDDSLDVVGVHGIGGTWGMIAIGLFATKSVNSSGADGVFYNNTSLLINQTIAVLAAWSYSFCVTFIIMKFLKTIMGVRVSREEELEGLDLSQHGESGYTM